MTMYVYVCVRWWKWPGSMHRLSLHLCSFTKACCFSRSLFFVLTLLLGIRCVLANLMSLKEKVSLFLNIFPISISAFSHWSPLPLAACRACFYCRLKESLSSVERRCFVDERSCELLQDWRFECSSLGWIGGYLVWGSSPKALLSQGNTVSECRNILFAHPFLSLLSLPLSLI